MKFINYARWGLALALPLAASTGFASPYGLPSYSAPNVPAPSLPAFVDTNETVKIQKLTSGGNTYWKLTGTGKNTVFSTLNSTSTWFNSYNLGSDSVKYEANFNSAGKLITSMGSTTLTNYLQINGSLPAGSHAGTTTWTAKSNQLLLKANLLDINPGNGAPDNIGTFAGAAIGFKTAFTGGWAPTVAGLTGGSTGESLWLAGLSADFLKLVKALDTNTGNGTLSSLFNTSSKTITGVVSVSSVPVPGAVWLFLTGMMAVLGLNRKKGNSLGL
ncbi:MAG: hypothetical protein ABL919_07210 [Methylococcales bacterium]